MRRLRILAICALTGGFVTLGNTGSAVAQTDDTRRLDIATVAEQLRLNEETQQELAPLLGRLNDIHEQRLEHLRQGDEIRQELVDTYDEIAETLSATQLREFHWLLRNTAVGPFAGRSLGDFYYGRGFRGRAYARPGVRGRGGFARGASMRAYPGRRMPMGGMRGGWGASPGWRYDDFYPND